MENIITKRPEGMSFEDYKTYMKVQNKAIKQYKKGNLMWLSKLYPTAEVLMTLREKNMEGDKNIGRLIHTGETFVGNTKDLK